MTSPVYIPPPPYPGAAPAYPGPSYGTVGSPQTVVYTARNPPYPTHVVVIDNSTEDTPRERRRLLGLLGDDNATRLRFTDKKVRSRFIQKVFAILLLQMLFMAGFVATFLFVPQIRDYAKRHVWMVWVSMVTMLIVYVGLGCAPEFRRKVPGNYVALVILTLTASWFAASISSAYETWIVLLAFGITIGSTVVVILLCFWVKFDLTSRLGIISMVAIGVVIFGLFSIFFYSRIIILLYSALMALILLVFIAIDTQLLLGGKRVELSEEDYVLAASQLFVDIVMLFTVLLTFIGAIRR